MTDEIRTSDDVHARDRGALDHIAMLMDGAEWDADTMDNIAETVRATGRVIRDVDEIDAHPRAGHRYAISPKLPPDIDLYLPDNYACLGTWVDEDNPRKPEWTIVGGTDRAGWTLDGYVIPRLASGLIPAQEIPHDDPRIQLAW